jgi:hypothetical protein
MPVVSVSPSDNWRITTAVAETVRNNAVTMLNTIGSLSIGGVDNDLQPVVISGPTVKNPNRGFFTPVGSVTVGRVVDTISRRRRQLVESATAPAYLQFS